MYKIVIESDKKEFVTRCGIYVKVYFDSIEFETYQSAIYDILDCYEYDEEQGKIGRKYFICEV